MAADDNELRLGVGADYSRGKYGSGTETTMLSVPFTARYETERWTYKATLPWLEVTGPSNFVPGFGHVDNSGKSGTGANDADAPTWRDRWDDPQRLPLLIRIEIEPKRGAAWPPLIVSPREAPEAGCRAWDMARLRCAAI